MKYGSFQVIRLDEVCAYTQTIPKLCTINVLQWRIQVLKKEGTHLYDFCFQNSPLVYRGLLLFL